MRGSFSLLLVAAALLACYQAAALKTELPSQNVPSGLKIMLFTGQEASEFAKTTEFDPYVFLGLCLRAVERPYIKGLWNQVLNENGRFVVLTTETAQTDSDIIINMKTILYYTRDYQKDLLRWDMLCTNHEILDSDVHMVVGTAEAEGLNNIVLVLDRKFAWARLRAVSLIKDTLNHMLEKQTRRTTQAIKAAEKNPNSENIMVSNAEQRLLKIYTEIEGGNEEVKTCRQSIQEERTEPGQVLNQLENHNNTVQVLQAEIEELNSTRSTLTGQALYEIEMKMRHLHHQMITLKQEVDLSHDAGVKNMVDHAEARREECNNGLIEKVWQQTVDRGRFNHLGFAKVTEAENVNTRYAAYEYRNTLAKMKGTSVYAVAAMRKYPVSVPDKTVV